MGDLNYVLDARTATDHFPGIGRYVSNLARSLAPQLAPAEHLYLLHAGGRPSRWLLPAASRSVSLWPVTTSPFSLSQQWLIPRFLRKADATVYHSPYYMMPYRPGVPTLLTVYDFIPQLLPNSVSRRARTFFRLTTGLALRAADHVTAISAATRKDMLTLYSYPEERITAIPLAADPRFHPQPMVEVARVRRALQLPENYVLSLGINKPHKNLLRLVQAWNLVVRQLEEPPLLVFAGAWDDRYPEARDLAAELGMMQHIHFVGPVTDADLPGLFAGATLFVFPSLYEGFGLPVIEAMACGVPVACARASSLPEVAGDAAWLFDPARPETMAADLRDLLTDRDRLEAMRERGLRQAARFSWHDTAARTLQLYRRLAVE